MTPVSVLGYACFSAHGPTPEHFWNALKSRETPRSFSLAPALRGTDSELSFLTRTLVTLTQNIQSQTSFVAGSRLGVIFASTKGAIDDFIWDEKKYREHENYDSLTPVLESFLHAAKLSPALSISVSNACASSLSAIFLGQKWIEEKRVDQVLVLSADLAGEFVQKGFSCLQALSPTYPKPFAKNRDGLTLGEAVTAILIGEASANFPLQIDSVGINAEGYAVTRPSPSGASLKRAYAETSKLKPDLIIAHGTATVINDIAEDQAFFELFGNDVPITGTKWAIGHTLGASGSMDLIAALETMKRGETFSLGTTREIDPAFRCNYLSRDSVSDKHPLDTILISSLGFGGVHAIATVTRISSGSQSVTPMDGGRPDLRELNPSFLISESRIDFTFAFPALKEPDWKNKVDRWYQLDAPAYALTEFYQQHASQLGPHPDLIVLASPSASNATDYQFASLGAQSPAKFVHTLPNIRLSPLCQVMNWNGPVLCLQNGQKTLDSALIEAKYLLGDPVKRIWILSVKDLTVTGFVIEKKTA